MGSEEVKNSKIIEIISRFLNFSILYYLITVIRSYMQNFSVGECQMSKISRFLNFDFRIYSKYGQLLVNL